MTFEKFSRWWAVGLSRRFGAEGDAAAGGGEGGAAEGGRCESSAVEQTFDAAVAAGRLRRMSEKRHEEAGEVRDTPLTLLASRTSSHAHRGHRA